MPAPTSCRPIRTLFVGTKTNRFILGVPQILEGSIDSFSIGSFSFSACSFLFSRQFYLPENLPSSGFCFLLESVYFESRCECGYVFVCEGWIDDSFLKCRR
jgi:hypothetical protein